MSRNSRPKHITFADFVNYGDNYFSNLRAQVEAILDTHYEIPEQFRDAAVRQALRTAKNYANLAGNIGSLVHTALVATVRHNVLSSNDQKTNAAHALGSERLADRLSETEYKRFCKGLAQSAAVVVRGWCIVPGCRRHQTE